MLEKIIWSCPDFKKIFIMVRPKKGKEISERLTKLLGSGAFERIKKRDPDFLSWVGTRLVPVGGDIVEHKFGLNSTDMAMVVEETNIVINNAASVNFTDRLDIAIKINTLGPLNMINLAHDMKNLEICTHVSTAYVNCNRPAGFIEEKIYSV